jgi:hypothetical protein
MFKDNKEKLKYIDIRRTAEAAVNISHIKRRA